MVGKDLMMILFYFLMGNGIIRILVLKGELKMMNENGIFLKVIGAKIIVKVGEIVRLFGHFKVRSNGEN